MSWWETAEDESEGAYRDPVWHVGVEGPGIDALYGNEVRSWVTLAKELARILEDEHEAHPMMEVVCTPTPGVGEAAAMAASGIEGVICTILSPDKAEPVTRQTLETRDAETCDMTPEEAADTLNHLIVVSGEVLANKGPMELRVQKRNEYEAIHTDVTFVNAFHLTRMQPEEETALFGDNAYLDELVDDAESQLDGIVAADESQDERDDDTSQDSTDQTDKDGTDDET